MRDKNYAVVSQQHIHVQRVRKKGEGVRRGLPMLHVLLGIGWHECKGIQQQSRRCTQIGTIRPGRG